MPVTIYPVIMCGGASSRLWPKSRRAQPKQFLSLIEEDSLLEATIKRLRSAPSDIEIAPPTVICGAGQDGLARRQLIECGYPDGQIIIEPFGRDTAAVAAVASLHAQAADEDAVVLLMPADHYMQAPEGFWAGVAAGLPAAEDSQLVTLGIEPTGPETGYGYIQKGEALGNGVYQVENFKEKPDRATAAQYLATEQYFWNAGIFLFRADAMAQAFEAHAPEILSACTAAINDAAHEDAQYVLDANQFETCPAVPVDIAIMEQADRVAIVAPVRAGWSDVGSWSVIADLKADTSDPARNATSGDVLAEDCMGCLIETDGPTIAAIGLRDMVVIADGGSILIVPKSQAQDVKAIVNRLMADGRSEKL